MTTNAKALVRAHPMKGRLSDEIKEVEFRCGDCIEVGCECPKGFGTYINTCPVCDDRFVAIIPGCLPEDVTCPGCEATVDVSAE